MEYEMLFFKFAFGLTLAVKKVEDRQVGVGTVMVVEVLCKWKLKKATADKAEVLTE